MKARKLRKRSEILYFVNKKYDDGKRTLFFYYYKYLWYYSLPHENISWVKYGNTGREFNNFIRFYSLTPSSLEEYKTYLEK